MNTAAAPKSPLLVLLAIAALAVLLSLFAGLMGLWPSKQQASGDKPSAVAVAQPARQPAAWAAMAPGRVEPSGGEIRLTSQAAGRITEIAVAVNDQVQTGDLLVRLDDEEARARLLAADAEAAVRRRERDAEAAVGRPAADRRQAEDLVAASERAALIARTELDRTLRARRAGTATSDDVARERAALAAATEKVDTDRVNLRKAQTVQGIPLPTRLEAGLTASRADVMLAEQALERTRLRAPGPGTVLQILPRIGETVAPSPEQVVVVIGDLSKLRVRAEVEERDVARIAVGQKVVLRTDAYPGREFAGTVATRAQSLGTARLAQRGPRRPTDLDVLEVMIDIEGGTPLLPGMRVDAFFRAEPPPNAEPATPPSPPKTN